MLAGQYAADIHTEFQNVSTKRFRTREVSRLHHIVHDQRVKVPVARVKDVGHRKPIALGHLRDLPEHIGELAPWDGTVHAKHVWCDATGGCEGRLASRPDAIPVLLRGAA